MELSLGVCTKRFVRDHISKFAPKAYEVMGGSGRKGWYRDSNAPTRSRTRSCDGFRSGTPKSLQVRIEAETDV
jgi:hypothetical protein